jgi:ACS family tartrate transporter-like MFS transporter
MLIAAVGYGTVALSTSLLFALMGFMLANIGVYASLSIFWSIPQTYFSAKAKPAVIAIISSFGAIFGGWIVPMIVGRVQQTTHSLGSGMIVVALFFSVSTVCVFFAGRRMVTRA